MHGLEDQDPAEVHELQTRFFAALGPAFDQLEQFAAHVTPRERARSYEPGASPEAVPTA
jgi:hypothetical protein